MPLVTLFLLLAACLPVAWPQSPLGLSPRASLLATTLAVAFSLSLSAMLSRWVVRTLRTDPFRWVEVVGLYLRVRTILYFLNLSLVIGIILGLGWGATVQQWCLVEHHGELVLAPLAELLVPLPYFLILSGSWLVYYDAERALRRCHGRSSATYWSRGEFWVYNFRQVLLLLVIPVVLFALNQSVNRWWPEFTSRLEYRVASLGVLLVLMLFLPLAMGPLLGLQRLPNGPTRARLTQLAHRIGLRYRDFLVWPTRGGMANAMIFGLLPSLRYVVFTDRLLEELPPQHLDAVLGHEAGHAHHGHLPYYLIFLVMSILALSCLGLYLLDWIDPQETFPDYAQYWISLPPLILVASYLFVVFGMLSRRCERQADVFGAWAVSCGNPACQQHDESTRFPSKQWSLCPTGLRLMAETLERVHLLNGLGLDRQPRGLIPSLWVWLKNWIHGPIPQRMAFLLQLANDPSQAQQTQRQITLFRWGLLILLLITILGFGELLGWEKVLKAL